MEQTGPRPTAIICGNDHLATGVLLEAQSLGIEVPGELSVTGFDDIALSHQLKPSLTTMRVDTAEIGRLAAHTMLRMLAGETDIGGTEIEPVLFVRESSGAPQAR